MRLTRLAAVAAVALCLWAPVPGGALVNPKEAPEWTISEWIQGDPGNLRKHKGRVVVIHFFQLWCPGCNNFTIPLVQRWNDLWGDRDDFMTVSIHSVFEGHDYQTDERLSEFVSDKGIVHSVGVDAYDKNDPEVPITMRRYGNTGTPQVAVVDKEGNLVFNHFGSFDPATVEFMIERLLKEKSEDEPPPKPKIGRNERLSGTYKLQFEQVSKTCGKLRPPTSANMKLEVLSDRFTADFTTRMMGHSTVNGRFDARSLRFGATISETDSSQNAQIESKVVVTGQFVRGVRPPQLEYEARFTRVGSLTNDCEILGRGTAQRIGD